MKLTLNTNKEVYEEFSHISELFPSYRCYLVGGCVRDSLLSRPSKDIDIATSCSPVLVHSLFPDGTYYPKYGTTSFKKDGFEVTIASLRKETAYLDFRHPSKIEFVSDIKEDYVRRDFTINALYVDSFLNLIDPSRLGLADIKNRLIRMIGNPDFRLKEDPLRMIRAYRFSLELGFILESSLEESILRNLELIHRLKPVKIKEEINKLSNQHKDELIRKLLLEEIYYQDC